jgi:hypothetical protein
MAAVQTTEMFLLASAAMQGNAEDVADALRRLEGVDGLEDKLTQALVRAARTGCVAVVVVLLADGRADPAARPNDALAQATTHGCVDVIRALLSDARVAPGASHVLYAIVNGHAEALAALLADPRVDLPTLAASPKWLPPPKLRMRAVLAAATRWRRRQRWVHVAAAPSAAKASGVVSGT